MVYSYAALSLRSSIETDVRWNQSTRGFSPLGFLNVSLSLLSALLNAPQGLLKGLNDGDAFECSLLLSELSPAAP